MNLTIHQSIHIHLLKIGSIANSSVVQIGSTGSIQGKSDIHNTGGFTELAEQALPVDNLTPLVPLSPIT
ncbi:spore germination protein GerPB [Oceanobacillus bengalensis]|uniref:Spore gernimation protein KA n=1 Tax=Oceanobacillus bengalensis TaxID=1435466 RepID=A0A494Z8A8_9BACI|nr:spore germination protein GerPB [Oceanobacillus bengalensis]RKQ18834.1 spore gernimation protein KA [Oceanobacillus bengalensis]